MADGFAEIAWTLRRNVRWKVVIWPALALLIAFVKAHLPLPALLELWRWDSLNVFSALSWIGSYWIAQTVPATVLARLRTERQLKLDRLYTSGGGSGPARRALLSLADPLLVAIHLAALTALFCTFVRAPTVGGALESAPLHIYAIVYAAVLLPNLLVLGAGSLLALRLWESAATAWGMSLVGFCALWLPPLSLRLLPVPLAWGQGLELSLRQRMAAPLPLADWFFFLEPGGMVGGGPTPVGGGPRH